MKTEEELRAEGYKKYLKEALAWEEYEEKTAPFWKEYREKTAPFLEKYYEKKAKIEAETN